MHLTILGIPLAKQSARFKSVKMGAKTFVKSYQKDEVVEKEYNIGFDIKSQLPLGFKPYDCPLAMKVVFVFPPLGSWTKKQKAAFTSGITMYKDKKPDIDNISKLIFDSMNGIVFIDDARVVDYSAKKIFGDVPLIEIEISELINP